ncbi:T9SS type A sorting domain-containing protein, partial [bacterium]|nr:T9SS type A sorting domain-containing protein [bacterium]
PTLFQNSPNPFNAATDIEFSIPQSENVKLVVTDVLGKRVKTLYNGTMAQGNHSIRWDSKDEKGNIVSSGVYFYKLTVGDNFVDKKKMTLIK